MPSTEQALAIFLLAVLPGALYTWAFEREAGKWGIGAVDRILRFIAASAAFQLVYAVALQALDASVTYQTLLFRTASDAPVAEQLRAIEAWRFLAAAATYVALPLLAGTAAAYVERRRAESASRRWLARIVNGRAPAPRAWDHLFAPRPGGVLRARLKGSGAWVGGLFGELSYAAGYPEAPQDIYVERAYEMADDGEFLYDGDDYIELGSGLLVRWEEIEFLEFFAAEGA
jgi:hypothetical protein